MASEGLERSVAGGSWLFLSNIINSLFGLAFWLVIVRLVGADAVGIAGAVVSAGGGASILASAGLGVAIAREVAAHSGEAVGLSLMVGLMLGGIGLLLGLLLGGGLEFGVSSLWSGAFALLSVLSQTLLGVLMGLERFRALFLIGFIGNLARLLLGIGLAVMGLGVLAPIFGYLTLPLVGAILGLAIVSGSLKTLKINQGKIGSFLSLVASNYPFVLGGQILYMLGVYAFALVSGEALATGVLYISMTITMALAAVPGSLLSASLPIATRRDEDPFIDLLKLGLSILAPLSAGILVAPDYVLGLLNPDLVGGGLVLSILVISLPPFTILTAVIMRLNKIKSQKQLVFLGLASMLSMLVLVVPLAEALGAIGAALAFLVANIVPLPLASRHMGGALIILAKTWVVLAASSLILGWLPLKYVGIPWPLASALAVVGGLVLVHLANLARIGELLQALKVAVHEISGHHI